MSTPTKPKGKGMTWDATAEASLFKCVLARHAPVKVDYQGLEKDMRDLGYECTAKAITHRIQKIKTVSTASDPDTDPATTLVTTPAKTPATHKSPATPAKGTTAAAAKGKGAAGKGKAKRKHDEVEDEQKEEEQEGHGEKKVKVEEDEGEG
ncbi:MAG: hypothetical protein Q9171_001072, partial [Xanthocarpia ochracea]